MNEISRRVLGTTVVRAAPIHDYMQLFLEGGAILNVFTSFRVIGADLSALEARRIVHVEEGDGQVTFSFEPEAELTVGLTDGPRVGPESMEYIGPGNVIVVWT